MSPCTKRMKKGFCTRVQILLYLNRADIMPSTSGLSTDAQRATSTHSATESFIRKAGERELADSAFAESKALNQRKAIQHADYLRRSAEGPFASPLSTYGSTVTLPFEVCSCARSQYPALVRIRTRAQWWSLGNPGPSLGDRARVHGNHPEKTSRLLPSSLTWQT
jgi:hypothetical protein